MNASNNSVLNIPICNCFVGVSNFSCREAAFHDYGKTQNEMETITTCQRIANYLFDLVQKQINLELAFCGWRLYARVEVFWTSWGNDCRDWQNCSMSSTIKLWQSMSRFANAVTLSNLRSEENVRWTIGGRWDSSVPYKNKTFVSINGKCSEMC